MSCEFFQLLVVYQVTLSSDKALWSKGQTGVISKLESRYITRQKSNYDPWVVPGRTMVSERPGRLVNG